MSADTEQTLIHRLGGAGDEDQHVRRIQFVYVRLVFLEVVMFYVVHSSPRSHRVSPLDLGSRPPLSIQTVSGIGPAGQ